MDKNIALGAARQDVPWLISFLILLARICIWLGHFISELLILAALAALWAVLVIAVSHALAQ